MTIKEIEDRTGLPRANIRFYESQGLIAPSRGENGYRDYSQEDCQTLLKIKLLRKLDVPLEEIRRMQLPGGHPVPPSGRTIPGSAPGAEAGPAGGQIRRAGTGQGPVPEAAGGPGGLVLHGPGPLSLLGPFHPSG